MIIIMLCHHHHHDHYYVVSTIVCHHHHHDHYHVVSTINYWRLSTSTTPRPAQDVEDVGEQVTPLHCDYQDKKKCLAHHQ